MVCFCFYELELLQVQYEDEAALLKVAVFEVLTAVCPGAYLYIQGDL